MERRSLRVFLDTSVIFAAVLSDTGGARVLFRLGEAGMLQLVIGPNVLRECEEVVLRKKPGSLPALALLLELGLVEAAGPAAGELLERALAIVAYEPDAHVLAEALGARPDWFVTHDQAHFLKIEPGATTWQPQGPPLPFRIGTPGDLIRALSEDLSSP
jgi:predicted nucleic acid-binding protein